MLRRLWAPILFLVAMPASANDHGHEHGHNCLGHHWADCDYYMELKWQLVAFTLMVATYLAFKLFTKFRSKTAQ